MGIILVTPAARPAVCRVVHGLDSACGPHSAGTDDFRVDGRVVQPELLDRERRETDGRRPPL